MSDVARTAKKKTSLEKDHRDTSSGYKHASVSISGRLQIWRLKKKTNDFYFFLKFNVMNCCDKKKRSNLFFGLDHVTSDVAFSVTADSVGQDTSDVVFSVNADSVHGISQTFTPMVNTFDVLSSGPTDSVHGMSHQGTIRHKRLARILPFERADRFLRIGETRL